MSEAPKEFPRLTEVGDTADLRVHLCAPETRPEGEVVVFIFTDYPGAELALNRVGVDAALLKMNYFLPPERKGEAEIVNYADVAGDVLRFTRKPPTRGTTPLWSITKPPRVSAVNNDAPHETTQAELNADARKLADEQRAILATEAKRQAIRERYDAEAVRTLTDLVPKLKAIAKKKKIPLVVNFDVNAAVANQIISMEKAGCR